MDLSNVPREDLEAGYDNAILLTYNMAERLDLLTTLAVMALDSGINTLPADLVLKVCQAGGMELDAHLAARWERDGGS